MVEGIFSAIIDFLLGAKFVTLNFSWRMNVHFQDKSHIKNDFFRFILLHLEFHFFYCSKDLKSLSLCTLRGVWRVDFYEKNQI